MEGGREGVWPIAKGNILTIPDKVQARNMKVAFLPPHLRTLPDPYPFSKHPPKPHLITNMICFVMMMMKDCYSPAPYPPFSPSASSNHPDFGLRTLWNCGNKRHLLPTAPVTKWQTLWKRSKCPLEKTMVTLLVRTPAVDWHCQVWFGENAVTFSPRFYCGKGL